MTSLKTRGRIIGGLLLLSFITGISIFQVIQGPVLFADDYLALTAEQSGKIISSTIMGIANGSLAVLIAALLIPVFRKVSHSLPYLYLGFAVFNLAMIGVDNISVLSLLEVSKEYIAGGGSNEALIISGKLAYQQHWWTHYMSLLVSTLPAFMMYFLFFRSGSIPVILAGIGMVAVIMMAIELLFSIYGSSINMMLMMPLGLTQLALIIWLLVKGLKE